MADRHQEGDAMALSDDDKHEIMALVAAAVAGTKARGPEEGPRAEDILPLIRQPHILVKPGPLRSRYSGVDVLDDQGRVVRTMKVRTSAVRDLLLDAFREEPGEQVPPGMRVEVHEG